MNLVLKTLGFFMPKIETEKTNRFIHGVDWRTEKYRKPDKLNVNTRIKGRKRR